MSAPFTIVERLPTLEEYGRLIAAVGFRPRQREAIELALRHSWFAVCAESEGEAIGMGRVIGDGGLHLYLTDVVVHPACQRRGVGTAIVAALTAWVDALPFPSGWTRSHFRVGGRAPISEYGGRAHPHARTRRLLLAARLQTSKERQPGDDEVGEPAARGVTASEPDMGVRCPR